MLTRYAQWLIGYGLVLILLGLALIAYDPHQKQVTLYLTAVSGLIAASIIGVLSIISGFLVKKGFRAGLWSGLVITFLALSMLFMQSKRRFSQGNTYAGSVIGLMAAASFFTLVNVARGVAFLPPAKKNE